MYCKSMNRSKILVHHLHQGKSAFPCTSNIEPMSCSLFKNEAFRDLGSRMVRGQSQQEQMGEHAKVNQTRVILRGVLLVLRVGSLLTNETGGLRNRGQQRTTVRTLNSPLESENGEDNERLSNNKNGLVGVH